MEIVWLIAFTAELPPTYLKAGGGLTYQKKHARRYGSKEEAEARMRELKMPSTWEAIQAWDDESTSQEGPGRTISPPPGGVSPPKKAR